MKSQQEQYIRFLEQAVLRPKEKSYLSRIIRERLTVLFFRAVRWLYPGMLPLKSSSGLSDDLALRHREQLRNSVLIISGESKTPGHVYRVERILESFYHLGIHGRWIAQENAAEELHLLNNCKLLILWRTSMDTTVEIWILKAKTLNIPVWFDIDDYLFAPELAQSGHIDSMRTYSVSEQKVRSGMLALREPLMLADLATCPTLPLADAIRQTGKEVLVIPNGYTEEVFNHSRQLAADRRKSSQNLNIRIGYAGGTLTHQQDFRVALPALARILDEFPHTILTVFMDSLLLNEFPELLPFHDRVETRQRVPLSELPYEINRFDINLAPLEINPFCEAKSELKYFEAALLKIPTIATPTQPFRQSVRHGVNGFLAASEEEWYEALKILVTGPAIRQTVGQAAYDHVQYHFSSEQRIHMLYRMLREQGVSRQFNIRFQQQRDEALNRATDPAACYHITHPVLPQIPPFISSFSYQTGCIAQAGILLLVKGGDLPPEPFIHSLVTGQANPLAMTVVISQPDELTLAAWRKTLEGIAERFSGCHLLSATGAQTSGVLRNLGFMHLDARYIFILENDLRMPENHLRDCMEGIRETGASLVRRIHNKNSGTANAFLAEKFDDHLSLVSKASWSKAGGFDTSVSEKNLYLRFASQGFFELTLPEQETGSGQTTINP